VDCKGRGDRSTAEHCIRSSCTLVVDGSSMRVLPCFLCSNIGVSCTRTASLFTNWGQVLWRSALGLSSPGLQAASQVPLCVWLSEVAEDWCLGGISVVNSTVRLVDCTEQWRLLATDREVVVHFLASECIRREQKSHDIATVNH